MSIPAPRSIRNSVWMSVGITLALQGCAGTTRPAGAPSEWSWSADRADDYRFAFQRECFCVPEAVEPVVIEVRDGAVVSVRSRRTGKLMPDSESVAWLTIPDLLAEAEDARDSGEKVDIDYHPSGYPAQIEIGSLAADAGTRYTISDVQPLP